MHLDLLSVFNPHYSSFTFSRVFSKKGMQVMCCINEKRARESPR